METMNSMTDLRAPACFRGAADAPFGVRPVTGARADRHAAPAAGYVPAPTAYVVAPTPAAKRTGRTPAEVLHMTRQQSACDAFAQVTQQQPARDWFALPARAGFVPSWWTSV